MSINAFSDYFDDSFDLASWSAQEFDLDESDAIYIASCAEHFLERSGLDSSNSLQAFMYMDVIEKFIEHAFMEHSGQQIYESMNDVKFIAKVFANMDRSELIKLMESMDLNSPKDFPAEM